MPWFSYHYNVFDLVESASPTFYTLSVAVPAVVERALFNISENCSLGIDMVVTMHSLIFTKFSWCIFTSVTKVTKYSTRIYQTVHSFVHIARMHSVINIISASTSIAPVYLTLSRIKQSYLVLNQHQERTYTCTLVQTHDILTISKNRNDTEKLEWVNIPFKTLLCHK